jgi:hypothetical protein
MEAPKVQNLKNSAEIAGYPSLRHLYGNAPHAMLPCQARKPLCCAAA